MIRRKNMRLDQFLVHEGHCDSRARAQSLIAAGLVTVNGVVIMKASKIVGDGDAVAVTGAVHDFVSRGGMKLDAALKAFAINPDGKICLDLGVSTGGFTDVLLRHGAGKVYAVDVGRDQLHQKIAGDPRVVNLEQTHAKDLTRALVPEPVDLIVCDVSFISLKKALPFALALAAPGAQLAALVKPQFEVGPEGVGKGGLVKEGLAEPVAQDISRWLESEGWSIIGLIDSPILGGDGNREFLIGASKTA
ncbi:MAG: TlyA family RNA methyltransferase [Parvularculaceae bacterium]